jgi:hypothetical protein
MESSLGATSDDGEGWSALCDGGSGARSQAVSDGLSRRRRRGGRGGRGRRT